jgi:hypothetical protein
MLVLLLAESVLAATNTLNMIHTPRGILPAILFFLMIVRESTVTRDSDEEIVEAIEEERSTARATALQELMKLGPAIALAALGYYVMSNDGELAHRVGASLNHHYSFPDLPWMRSWSPMAGVATAATGFVIAGALGWTVRIVFTLVLGKEAFGVGDIHLMAAAGCVAGWPVVVLGFFLATFLALAGWLLVLPFKRARALPLGPWLTLGFLCVTVFYEPIVQMETVQRIIAVGRMLFLGSVDGSPMDVGG